MFFLELQYNPIIVYGPFLSLVAQSNQASCAWLVRECLRFGVTISEVKSVRAGAEFRYGLEAVLTKANVSKKALIEGKVVWVRLDALRCVARDGKRTRVDFENIFFEKTDAPLSVKNMFHPEYELYKEKFLALAMAAHARLGESSSVPK